MATGYPVQTVIGEVVTATLTNGTPHVESLVGKPLPLTICLKSADANRRIRLSASGVGANDWFLPDYDVTDANKIIVSVSTPLESVEITGIANDVWSIQ